MNSHEIERAVVEHIARIEQLARMVDRSHWPAGTTQRLGGVRDYLERLVAHVLHEGGFSLRESMLLRTLGGGTETWEEAAANAKQTVDQHPDAPWIAPLFVRAAKAQDAAMGTLITSAILGELESLCALVALADGSTGPGEPNLIAAIRSTLTA